MLQGEEGRRAQELASGRETDAANNMPQAITAAD